MDFALPQIQLQILKQGRLFIAYSHTFDIATTGKSEKLAVKKFGDLMHVFMKEVVSRGILAQSLTEKGWTHRAKRWEPPAES